MTRYRTMKFENFNFDDFDIDENRRYKIYTSKDGIIYFTMDDLEHMDGNRYWFNFDFRVEYQTFQNQIEIIADLDKMFVFIETSNGDFAEYKIF